MIGEAVWGCRMSNVDALRIDGISEGNVLSALQASHAHLFQRDLLNAGARPSHYLSPPIHLESLKGDVKSDLGVDGSESTLVVFGIFKVVIDRSAPRIVAVVAIAFSVSPFMAVISAACMRDLYFLVAPAPSAVTVSGASYQFFLPGIEASSPPHSVLRFRCLHGGESCALPCILLWSSHPIS